MSSISKVTVTVATGDLDGAGTSGEVYLGLGGMEFKLDSVDVADFDRDSERTYILGDEFGSFASTDQSTLQTFAHSSRNDPRMTTMERVARHPVYIRLHPVGNAGDWLVRASWSLSRGTKRRAKNTSGARSPVDGSAVTTG